MFTISWKDNEEKYDNKDYVDTLSISPELPKSIDNHYLIKGDNYPVLIKLNEVYKEQVDIIYIDPPYNTGNEFAYKDSFGTGSAKHDAWLSFMSRRLKLALSLLKETGCIYIAIDQSELYVLKLLCDSIFGEDNFVNDFMWLHGKGKKDSWSRTLQQHTLCYAKNKKKLNSFRQLEETEYATKNLDNDPRGEWFSGSISFNEKRSNPKHKNYFTVTSPSGVKWTRQWQCSKEEMDSLISDNKIYFGPSPSFDRVPRKKIFNNEIQEVIPKNIIDMVETTRGAQSHVDELLGAKGVFDNPKPVSLITHLISITNMTKDAVVLDFFGGSGTTFEAVCELNEKDGGNRKAIIVQKDEKCVERTEVQKIKRMEKNTITFDSIYEICKARIKKVCELYDSNLFFSNASLNEYCLNGDEN